jgi:hypothetical protein
MSTMNTMTNLSNSGMNTKFIQVHEMCMSIGESKRHNQILIQPVSGRECSLRNIFWTDLDLMVTRMKIDLVEDHITDKLIKKNVDVGQRIFVLDDGGIQRPVINIASKIDLSPSRIMLDNPKATIHSIVPSILPTPWVSSYMEVWK